MSASNSRIVGTDLIFRDLSEKATLRFYQFMNDKDLS